jgi:hypothetical protein
VYIEQLPAYFEGIDQISISKQPLYAHLNKQIVKKKSNGVGAYAEKLQKPITN